MLAHRLTRFALVIAVGGFVAGCACASPPADSADFAAALITADSLVAAWVQAERIPGAVLLVSKDGQVVLDHAYGWAEQYDYGDGQYAAWGTPTPTGRIHRLADPVPMTTETVFDLASVTKMMATTFAVMTLVDDGAIDVGSLVSRYLPDFRGGGKEDITVRHLLTHTSGLTQWQPTYYHASTADEAYAFIRDFPLAWPVGAERHYSDLGFMLLGRIVEQVSGMRLDAFVRSRVYEPLGLEHTGFRPADGGAEGVHAEADGGGTGAAGAAAPYRATDVGAFAATSPGNPYEYRMVHDSTFGYRIAEDADAWDGWRRRTLVGEVSDGNAWYAFGGVAGHAGLFSNAADLQVLLQLLLDRGAYGGHRYLRAETVDEFLAPQLDGQALGWQVPSYAPEGSFVHTGFTGTYVLGVPAEGLSVVLLTNRENEGVDAQGLYPDVGPLQRGVAEALVAGAERRR